MNRHTLVLASSLLVLGGCGDDDGEREIDLDQVPPAVLQAARDELPGIELTDAEIIQRGDRQVYELEGKVDGVEMELILTPDGQVLQVEEDR